MLMRINSTMLKGIPSMKLERFWPRKTNIGQKINRRIWLVTSPHESLSDVGIELLLFLAVAITPLLFSPLSQELFEFPKIVFVYLLAIAGISLVAYTVFIEGRIARLSKGSMVAVLLFVAAMVASTITSMDWYSSVAGYYSRFYGGLASLVAMLVLFYLALLYFSPQPATPKDTVEKTGLLSCDQVVKLRRLAWAWCGSAFGVSLWGIAQHFGYDFGCFLLGREINANCWVQDGQARVFASFGQPNWLAAYLLTSMPLGLGLLLTSKSTILKFVSWLIVVASYAAWWYTYSRAGWIGLGVTLLILLPWLVRIRNLADWKWLAAIGVSCLLISLSTMQMAEQRTATSLESGGLDTSTGQIRLLVWQGSWEAAMERPILGSGPETFAYSFLPHRPAELNQTTEWNFLYNKAHNEVLHMLVTAGLVGTATWLAIYGLLLWRLWQWRLWQGWNPGNNHAEILILSVVAGMIGVFFAQLLGFSVVMTGLLFWMGLAVVLSPEIEQKRIQLPTLAGRLGAFLGGVALPTMLFLGLLSYATAEVVATGAKQSLASNPWLSSYRLEVARKLNPFEPEYAQQLALAHAYAAQQDGEDSAQHVAISLEEAREAERLNPHNILTLKALNFAYRQLALVDTIYMHEALRVAEAATSLDDTDAVAWQMVAKNSLELGLLEKSKMACDRLLTLRPEDSSSYVMQASYFRQAGEEGRAIESLTKAVKLDPNDRQALDMLELLNE